ncbi:hypothetical protein [Ornithinimicrobium kibberense]|uniref:hypothetical protein n=1 Tax=Ornithinimicrobium kibberense TaxID=282060 RepID=UPI00360FE615
MVGRPISGPACSSRSAAGPSRRLVAFERACHKRRHIGGRTAPVDACGMSDRHHLQTVSPTMRVTGPAPVVPLDDVVDVLVGFEAVTHVGAGLLAEAHDHVSTEVADHRLVERPAQVGEAAEASLDVRLAACPGEDQATGRHSRRVER